MTRIKVCNVHVLFMNGAKILAPYWEDVRCEVCVVEERPIKYRAKYIVQVPDD